MENKGWNEIQWYFKVGKYLSKIAYNYFKNSTFLFY